MKSFIRLIAQKLPNIVRYNTVNVYGTIAGIFLAMLANIIAEIHIDFSGEINLRLLTKFIICLIIACILQNLHMKLSSIKEIVDREFGSYIKDCEDEEVEPDKSKKIKNFNAIINFKPYLKLYPYIVMVLLILYAFVN